jgi:alkanesulfonate monooxygenase SsuD/methylene tetrahydromethanopterin reductase-like flavin-dependent oxidoreductase (luciferase family)
MLASSSEQSLRRAAQLALPPLIGFRPNEELRARIASYRQMRLELGVSAGEVEREVAQIGILRRVHVAESDDQAVEDVIGPLQWYTVVGARVHRRSIAEHRDPRTGQQILPSAPQRGSLPDGSAAAGDAPSREEILRRSEGGMIAGSPATVLNRLRELDELGLGQLIAWMNLGNMPYQKVRRSMELLAAKVLPQLRSGSGTKTVRAG